MTDKFALVKTLMYISFTWYLIQNCYYKKTINNIDYYKTCIKFRHHQHIIPSRWLTNVLRSWTWKRLRSEEVTGVLSPWQGRGCSHHGGCTGKSCGGWGLPSCPSPPSHTHLYKTRRVRTRRRALSTPLRQQALSKPCATFEARLLGFFSASECKYANDRQEIRPTSKWVTDITYRGDWGAECRPRSSADKYLSQ